MTSDSREYSEHGGAVLTPAIVRLGGQEPAGEGETSQGFVAIADDTVPGEGGATGGDAAAGGDTAAGDGFVDAEPETYRHPSAEEVLDDVVDYFESAPAVFEEVPSPEFVRSYFFDFDYLERYEEIERYWVHEPYAYVTILYDEAAREYRYHVVEPELDLFEQYVRADLVTLLRNSLMYLEAEAGEDREAVFIERVHELVEKHAATVEVGTLHKLLYYLQRDFLHYGPIDAIMRDHSIEDISCDGVDVPVFVYHREYRDLKTNVSFEERHLNSFTVQLAQRAGKTISVSDPLLDASLPDGSRLQLTLGGDVSTRGSNFTIRKFADIPYTPVDLVNWNTFSVDEMAYFWLAIENNKSLIFAGGTGSGKTTSMNAVSFFIPPSSKVVTIEDTREIDLPHENWIQSVTRDSASGDGRGEVSMFNLLQAALRQRPEYLLVGEIRTEQRVALTFFQAMGTGHTAYTTIHADTVETALSRLQNPPLSVPTQMLQDLDIISIQKQTFIGDRRVRRNNVIAELGVDEDDPDRIRFDEVFRWNASEDAHERLGHSTVLLEIARDRGWDEEELDRQLENRKRVLEYLIDNGVTDYASVGSTIHLFARDQDAVMDAIENDSLPSGTGESDARIDAHDASVQHTDMDAVAEEYRTWEEVLAVARAEDAGHADDATTDHADDVAAATYPADATAEPEPPTDAAGFDLDALTDSEGGPDADADTGEDAAGTDADDGGGGETEDDADTDGESVPGSGTGEER